MTGGEWSSLSNYRSCCELAEAEVLLGFSHSRIFTRLKHGHVPLDRIRPYACSPGTPDREVRTCCAKPPPPGVAPRTGKAAPRVDSSVAVQVSYAALFPMDLRVGERGMRPGSDTALLTPLHPPLLLTPFSPQPRTSFTPQQLHQHIRSPTVSGTLCRDLCYDEAVGAVASSVVKQKLQEVILKKQKQAALERTNSNTLTAAPLGPDPGASSQTLVSSPPQSSPDCSERTPLRRAASEPNLKVKHKLKKHLNTRKSPLTRKESAPATVKHRAQRLLLRDGTIANFTIQSPSTLPTITLGLPANARFVLQSFSILFREAVQGLETVQLQFGPQLDHLAPGGAHPHKPLIRTRSEPLPQSPRTLHTHLLQQQHNTQLLERLKQQTHLGKVWRSDGTHGQSDVSQREIYLLC
ncbi:Histone deacetylase 7 [Liparis tanakae]|uniref:histone deacetylase n=1 Tax=Liparis tanakae TaxID=230148 RepID=A0A4Z2H6W1_9TELE|nr:Histone deacetylase 7 [Liparis tanakae]